MARKLSVISAELASWSTHYLSRDQDLHGTPEYGRLSERAAVLQHIVRLLDDGADLLLHLPRVS